MESPETARRCWSAALSWWARNASGTRGGAGALAVTGLALAGMAFAGCANPTPTPSLQGQVHLTLIHTADIHSRLLPYDLQLGETDAGLGLGATESVVNTGGAARVSYIVGRERARSSRVLHLDCGDSFQGAPIFNYFNGEPEIRSLSAMGTDVSVVANHEFDKGALNLGIQLQRWATFPVLAANYLFEDPSLPGASPLGSIVVPFTVLDVQDLKVGVIGMGNLSSLTSIFDTPNRLGITPLNTTETSQFYVDLIRPLVDVVVVLSHLGLEVDEQMIQTTTGIDIVLGSHNHIVLQPPRQVQDCSAYATAPFNHGDTMPFVLQDPTGGGQADVGCMADGDCGTNGYCFGTIQAIALGQGICKAKRYCHPRNVLLSHSGAFAKYVGRLDLLFSNNPADLNPACTPEYPPPNCATLSPSSSSSSGGAGGGGTGGAGSSSSSSGGGGAGGGADATGVAPACNVPCYDKLDGFELVTSDYTLFPVTEETPDDPILTSMLEPYAQTLDATANLNLLLGYSLRGSSRTATAGGDSPLGDMVATSMWLRLGIQTDFSLTNSTGIRTDIVPGVVTQDQMFNIFPFDNTITKISLAGDAVQQLFDYTALRSASRGCYSQAQIAGARIVIDCTRLACEHIDCGPGQVCDPVTTLCEPEGLCKGVTCPTGGTIPVGCEPVSGGCVQGEAGVATHIFIGAYDPPIFCHSDDDCPGKLTNQCDEVGGVCWQALDPLATYQLATSNYLAAGGSGFIALKGNTTQINSMVEQRDALIDYIRAGLPCGSNAEGQLQSCSHDTDCLKIACQSNADCGSGTCDKPSASAPGQCTGDDIYVCACPLPGQVTDDGIQCTTNPAVSCAGKGSCVLSQCRDDVATFQRQTCQAAPTDSVAQVCEQAIAPCTAGGEQCKYLACIDNRLGNYADGRVQMVGQ
jgi:5'-nucleotidase / UDP-sugar diphosphatase